MAEQRKWTGVSFGDALRVCLGLVAFHCPSERGIHKAFAMSLGVTPATLCDWMNNGALWDDHYNEVILIFPSLITAIAPVMDPSRRITKPGRKNVVPKKPIPSHFRRAQTAIGL